MQGGPPWPGAAPHPPKLRGPTTCLRCPNPAFTSLRSALPNAELTFRPLVLALDANPPLVLALVPASAHATLEYLIVTTAFSSLWSPARLSQRPGIPECTAGQDPRLLFGRVVDRGQSHRRKPKRKVNHENQNQNRGQSHQATLRVPPGDKATRQPKSELGTKPSAALPFTALRLGPCSTNIIAHGGRIRLWPRL